MTLAKYNYEKAIAHFEGNWRKCHYVKCRNLRKCTGGPRGTYRKAKGELLCKTKSEVDSSQQGII